MWLGFLAYFIAPSESEDSHKFHLGLTINISHIENSSKGQNFRLWKSGDQEQKCDLFSLEIGQRLLRRYILSVEYVKTHPTSIDLHTAAFLGRLGRSVRLSLHMRTTVLAKIWSLRGMLKKCF